MGIYVKGIKMPKTCEECKFSFWSNLCQTAACGLCDGEVFFDDFSLDYRNTRGCGCPLVELPEKHGDLIDRDALRDAVFHHLCIRGEEYLLPAEKSVFGNIIKAHTVIEAEGE